MPEEPMITYVCDDKDGFREVTVPLSEYKKGIQDYFASMEYIRIGNIKIWYDPEKADLEAPNIKAKIKEFKKQYAGQEDPGEPVSLFLSVVPETGEVFITQ